MRIESKSLAKKALVIAAFGFVLARALPSLADTNTPDPTPTQTSVATLAAPNSAPTIDPSSAPAASASSPASTATIIYKSGDNPQPADGVKDPEAISDSVVTVHVPTSIKVDPRAQYASIAPVVVFSQDDLLLCMKATGSRILLQGAQNGVETTVTADGSLLLTGNSAQLTQLLGQPNSLRLFHQNHVSGSTMALRAVAVTSPTLNADLCSTPNYSVSVHIKALGLELGTVKTPVKLGK
ncbi:MAG: hypothetical protein RL414_1008 [Actinomycetota bacterium]